jgi:hypothetical protein
MAYKEYKLDMFQVLPQIDKKNAHFIDGLTEDEIKGFVPYTTMRWLSGTNSAYQIMFINELVNPFMFSLGTHKGLLYKLMTVCGSGKTQRYKWNSVTSKKATNTPYLVSMVKDYYGYNTMNAIDALKILSKADLLNIAEHLGRQKDEIVKINNELKKINDN